MITRDRPGGYLRVRTEDYPDASLDLERDGYVVLRQAFSLEYIAELRSEIESVYESSIADSRGGNKGREIDSHFRYEMFNRSAMAQRMVGDRAILDVIEPLLGEDCHIIANTCWRNPSSDTSRHGGGGWHIDAGPHIPLQDGQSWPDDIPHPVFAIGVHIFLMDCPMECGPTGVIPRSHLSGKPPPVERHMDAALTWNGSRVKPLIANTGDVAFFVSDVWHRRLPPAEKHSGRFFLQIHYARRDIAQRIKPTTKVNHIDPAALARIDSPRERHLLGLHHQGFYDG